jgi:hypothetical protein
MGANSKCPFCETNPPGSTTPPLCGLHGLNAVEAGRSTGKFIFGPNGRRAFAQALRKAWHDAKASAGLLTAEQATRAARADRIREEIDALKYKSLRINIEPRRLALERELAALDL